MWTKSFIVEVILICLLALIPFPTPSVFKISCCRFSAQIVRKIVQSKWSPILNKYHVNLPLECPFHAQRDIFAPQETAKQQNRPSQWTCGFCGKSFYEEKYLDMHFELKHAHNINMAEDAVCLSDYCDIMRCDVFQDSILVSGNRMMSTDIEVYNEAAAYRTLATAISPTGPRDLTKVPPNQQQLKTPYNSRPVVTNSIKMKQTDEEESGHMGGISISLWTSKAATEEKRDNCDKTRNFTNKKEQSESEDDDDEGSGREYIGTKTQPTQDATCEQANSSVPPSERKRARLSELKANCKAADLDALKAKCHVLVRNCIAGLLVNLSVHDFKNMEDEMNRAVCSYLSCARYWEDGLPEPRAFPWALLLILAVILSSFVCLCYYIIWVIFESDDNKFWIMGSSSSSHAISSGIADHHPSPTHTRTFMPQSMSHHQLKMFNNSSTVGDGIPQLLSDDLYAANTHINMDPSDAALAAGQSEHYIYVTYPPELKRRLLESCYNRTTRL